MFFSRTVVDKRDNFGSIQVPKGKYFMMGDNRDYSYDSRFWGFADIDGLKGKADFICWSWDEERQSVRFDRLGKRI